MTNQQDKEKIREQWLSNPENAKKVSSSKKVYRYPYVRRNLTEEQKQRKSERNKKWQEKDRIVNKLRVFAHYSNGKSCCNCCGENNIHFLTIDHVNNDGKKHRKEINLPGGYKFYRWLIKNDFPEGLQVLCFNCNFGKNVNKGICPHKIVDGK